MPIYEVAKEMTFAAAHHLRQYQGACERVHGHNWRVRVTVRGREPGPGGMVLDFKRLKALMAGCVDRLDHQDLNTIPPFDREEPSAEGIAREIFERVREALGEGTGVWVHRVDVWETETSRASYIDGD